MLRNPAAFTPKRMEQTHESAARKASSSQNLPRPELRANTQLWEKKFPRNKQVTKWKTKELESQEGWFRNTQEGVFFFKRKCILLFIEKIKNKLDKQLGA